MAKFQITRQIGIDAGHRIPDHGSKCKSLHGHRYTIEATCSGELAGEGEEKDMVLDFSFLKQIMMEEIDERCDHGMILSIDDPIAANLIGKDILHTAREVYAKANASIGTPFQMNWVSEYGTKFHLIKPSPTAEVLARHWYGLMVARVHTITAGRAFLDSVKVWETPNCWAIYPSNSRG